jgi:hypothetical protein
VTVVYGDSSSHISGGGATGSDVTGNDVTEVCSAHVRIFPFFFLTIVVQNVVQVQWLPEETLTGSDGMCMRNRFPRFFLTIVVYKMSLKKYGKMFSACPNFSRTFISVSPAFFLL